MDKTIDRWTDPDGNGYAFKDTVARAQNRATIDKMNAETADRKSELDIERKRIDNLIKELPATAGEYKQSKLVLHSYGNTAVKCTTTSRNYTNVPAFTTDQGGALSSLYTKKSNYQIAVNKAGLYLFELRAHVNSLTANKRVELAPFVNDERNAALASSYNTAGSFTLTKIVTLSIWLNANDTIDFRIAPVDAAEVSVELGDVLVYAIDWDDKFKIPDYTGYANETKDLRVGADGTTYDTAGQAMREQIGSIKEDLTSKADKTALAKTDRKLDALWKLNQGISYEFQTDDTEAYQKTVPSGAKMVSIKSIGGKTIVWNQMISDGVGELMSAPVNEVVYLDTKNQETSYPIPQAVLNLPGYGWSAGDAKNEVNWENKKYIQRVGKYTIDGSEIIFKENKYWVMTVTDFEKPRPSTKNAICVNFKVTDTYSKEWGGIIFRTGSNGFVFTDSESKFANADEVKDYFQQNNETIYYEINEEQIIDISDIIDNTFQEPIEVEAGGTLTFRNSHGDDYRIPVPSSEEYVISLAEVAK